MLDVAPAFSRPDLLPERLADYLRNEIVAGRLQPSHRLVEQELATQLAVSRVPLREAFRILAAEGLIAIVPHRGAMVSALSGDELTQLFAVRAGLEAMAARAAAQAQPSARIDAMQQAIERMRRDLARRDLAAYYSLAAEFHNLLMEASENLVLVKLYNQIRTQFRRYQAAMARVPQLPAQSIREHELIVAAIQKRNPDAAAKAAEQHINSVVEQYRAWAGRDDQAAKTQTAKTKAKKTKR
jgi:DNA-binding GntR family transcriptional regulator